MNVKDVPAEGLHATIESTLQKWGILDHSKLAAVGGDGAAVIMGRNTGVCMRLQHSRQTMQV